MRPLEKIGQRHDQRKSAFALRAPQPLVSGIVGHQLCFPISAYFTGFPGEVRCRPFLVNAEKGPPFWGLNRYKKIKQTTFAMAADQGASFEHYRRPTKRDTFLQTMNDIVPWRELCEVNKPHYAHGEGVRPPIGLERMLRMHFVQHWFKLAD